MRRSAFSPYLHRPAFLEHEEDRLREGLSERDRQLQYMRDRLFQEQNEKEELKRAVSSVLEDNQRMKVRLQDLEAKVRDPEQKFSTPEGSQKQGPRPPKNPEDQGG